MIAVDTSSVIAYLENQKEEDVSVLQWGLEQKLVVFPPVVVSELLSDPSLSKKIIQSLLKIPMVDITVGYWERVGSLRRAILESGHKAKLADTLIAQTCIDHSLPLLTRDKDFHIFSKKNGLKLVLN